MKKLLIITASGNATRLRPLTSNMSKSMLSVNGKPVIAYILDETLDHYDHVVIVHNTNNDVPQFVKTAYARHLHKIDLIEQVDQIGVLYAAYLGCVTAEKKLGRMGHEYSVTVWLGDTIVTDYKTDGMQNELVVAQVPDYERWCMVDTRCNFYDKPSEKPPTDLALVGIYTFENFPMFIDIAERIVHGDKQVKNEYQMSQALSEYDSFKLVQTSEWYDCGDFPSLYKSKARLLSRLTREDNKIDINLSRNSVIKSGKRCVDEMNWYATVNDQYKDTLPFIPQLYSVDDTTCSYEIAYCTGATLQEIIAFENLRSDTIKYTINTVLKASYDAFMRDPYLVNKKSFEKLFMLERITRVLNYDFRQYGEFITQEDLDLYLDYVVKVYEELPELLFVQQPGHGDMHFGNIIFDYNLGSTKFIDPKGPITIPWLYDCAKFYQSFYGDYLWIKTNTVVNEQIKSDIIEEADKFFGENVTSIVKKLVPVLMGSILDFHKDAPDHQKQIWQKTIQLIKQAT